MQGGKLRTNWNSTWLSSQKHWREPSALKLWNPGSPAYASIWKKKPPSCPRAKAKCQGVTRCYKSTALQLQNWKKEFFFSHSIGKQTHQNMVRTAVMHSALPCVLHFDVICDLLLNRPTAVWNLFVNPSTLRPNL